MSLHASAGMALLVASVVALLASTSVRAAGNFGGLAFFSDAACTVPFNPSSVAGVNATYTQWSSLPASVVANAVQLNNGSFEPPCAAKPLPAFPVVASGEYACWNTEPANRTRGFVAAEWVRAGCGDATADFPFQEFFFSAPDTQSCVPGEVFEFVQDAQGNVISGAVNNQTWATFSCGGASAALSSSSTAAAGGNSPPSSTGSASNTGGNGNHNGSGAVRLSASVLVSLVVLLLAALFASA